MKLSDCIKQCRTNLLDALKHLDEVSEDRQSLALLTINSAIKELDQFPFILDGKKPCISRKPSKSPVTYDDDPTTKQLVEIWENMSTPDASNYKLMVMRLEPGTYKGTKIGGFIDTYFMPTTIPDIITDVGKKYGGGKYQIRIVDDCGKYVKSKTFEVSGLPKVPLEEGENPKDVD